MDLNIGDTIIMPDFDTAWTMLCVSGISDKTCGILFGNRMICTAFRYQWDIMSTTGGVITDIKSNSYCIKYCDDFLEERIGKSVMAILFGSTTVIKGTRGGQL